MITIKDVARLAGVSHTTVSLALRGSASITDETKKKVMKAAKQLNYHPNHLAKALVNGKTNVIGVVSNFFSSSPSLANAFTTFCPSRLSSIRAFSSPICTRCLRKASLC